MLSSILCSESTESDSFAVDASPLPSTLNYDVDISDDDDYTPKHMKLPRRNTSDRGAQVRADGRHSRARCGWREGRHGDGRGDADRRQAVNPTLADGTEMLWQPDNGLQTDWLQDLADATGKQSFGDIAVRIMEILPDEMACMQLKILVGQHGQCVG